MITLTIIIKQRNPTIYDVFWNTGWDNHSVVSILPANAYYYFSNKLIPPKVKEYALKYIKENF